MSEEWDEVKHEVGVMVEGLEGFRADLHAAMNSGEMTEDQILSARTLIDESLKLVLWNLKVLIIAWCDFAAGAGLSRRADAAVDGGE